MYSKPPSGDRIVGIGACYSLGMAVFLEGAGPAPQPGGVGGSNFVSPDSGFSAG